MILRRRKNYDRLPTNFFITQYMIKSIGNQIISASLPVLEVSSGLELKKKYYVALNVNILN